MKTRASVVAGLLENYETINEVIASAEQADGSAIRENERYLDSIEGRVQLFSNQMQEFWYNLISSDMVKEVVDAGTQLIKILDNITSSIDGMDIINVIVKPLSMIIDLIEKLTGSLGVLNVPLFTAGIVKLVKKIKGTDKGGGRAKNIIQTIIYMSALKKICLRIV